MHRLRALVLAAILTPVSSALAGSPVWKISDGKNHVFLGGTVHLLSADDYPLPPALSSAYDRSARVVLETDLAGMQTPATMAVMLNALSYPPGQSIRQFVSRDTYDELARFFGARGVGMAQIDGLRPGMISTMMTLLELQRLGLTAPGVDAHFEGMATRDGKALGRLESVEAQIRFLAEMGEGREDDLLRYSLGEIEKLPSLWPAVRDAWRDGDLARLAELGVAPLERDFPRIYEDLLVNRNNAWVPQIEAMLRSREIELVLVGALHLAGREGLIEQLGARGYAIEQLR